MSRVAVVGDSTSVLGFRALGVDTYSLDQPEEVVELWPTLVRQEYAVIFMTEPAYQAAGELIAQVEEAITPAVTVIPPTSGPTGVGRRRLSTLVERAIGSSKLF